MLVLQLNSGRPSYSASVLGTRYDCENLVFAINYCIIGFRLSD